MKKLLGLAAMLAIIAACVPNEASAALRGGFDWITTGPNFTPGIANGAQTPAARPGNTFSTGGYATVERFFSFTTRSQAPGFESSREIWQVHNNDQTGFRFDVDECRAPLWRDPTGVISYTDPSWSPDGRFLAFVITDKTAFQSSIWVQEYTLGTTMPAQTTTVGSPILVVPQVVNVANRHPDWSPDGTTLVYDSNATGLSVDLYKVQVFDGTGAVSIGSPVRLTFNNLKAEQNPAWAPDGVRIAFDTNLFGPNIIEILDTSTNAITPAEANFAPVGHRNPSWSSDGLSIYYDAPQGESPQSNNDIWKLDLLTQAKCDILLDSNGDLNVDVSRYANFTPDGKLYNLIYFESQAAGMGLVIWRGAAVNSCLPPLPMAVVSSPQTLNLGSVGQNLTFTISFPAETQAAGYQAQTFNGPKEGVRNRQTILRSPLFMDLDPNISDATGLGDIKDVVQGGEQKMVCSISRREIEGRLVALGLVDQLVPVQATAYSNNSGRRFQGYAYLRLSTNNLASSAVKLEQNSPNPFNPVTKIRFATSKAGNVSLRIYNVRGELVKTLADRNFDAGSHEVSWDGKNAAGLHTSSGVYYAKVSAAGGATDVMKMVMAK